MLAAPLAVAVTTRWVPAPPLTIAVHTDSSVWSAATSDVSFVYVLPPESVTDCAVAPPLRTPTTTTIRFPLVTLDPKVAALDVTEDWWLLACCTRPTLPPLVGVTAFDEAEAVPPPITLTAVTVNVYKVPFVRPVTWALVADPPTVTLWPPGEAVTV